MSSLPSKFSIAESLHRLSSLSKGIFVNCIEHKKDASVMMRMYYDSPLGSNIEQHCEKTMASATYNSIKSYLPKCELTEKIAKFIGTRIAHHKIKIMDREKLKYKYCKGFIKEDQYLKESSKRFVAATGAFVDKGWLLIGKGLKKGSEAVMLSLGVDPILTKEMSDGIWTVITLMKRPIKDYMREKRFWEKTEQAVYRARKDFIDGTRKLVNHVDEKIGKAIVKTKEFADNVSQKLGYNSLADFKHDVKEKAEEYKNVVIDKVSKAGKKVGAWVKKLFNRGK